MPSLRIFTFGAPRIEIDGHNLDVRRRKGLALLAYLAVTDRAHTREALATMLWPENDQSSALANLRRELSRLNQALGEGVLAIDRLQAGFDPEVAVWLDAAAFRSRLQAFRDEEHGPEEGCEACFRRLTEAAALYREDFLAGFNLPDSPGFDEWQFFQAEELRQGLAEALQWLIGWHISQGEYGQGVEYARRWLALDPLHEPAHRQLMQLYDWNGQQAAALRQYQECVRLLSEELGLEPDPETTALYEAIRARQLPAPVTSESPSAVAEIETAPEAPRSAARLPAQVTGFVGREVELTEICRLLDTEANCRLLTLIGPGGMGKTRLALEAAARLESAFPQGVYFVPLASLSRADEIVPAIIQALGLHVFGGADLETQLLKYLGDKQLLIVLDNFEHLVEGAGVLGKILERAAQAKLLVTSRQRLNLRAEWPLEVSGMRIPEQDAVPTLEITDLEKYGATSLFYQRARQAHPDFHLEAADLPALVRICSLVGGMPLGLELAAAWVRYAPLEEIAGRIAADLDFLATRLQDVPERHRSLRAVFDQTWSQLSGEVQAILRKMAVFRGGFEFHAAEQVAGAQPAQLAGLADRALLTSVSAGRYELHELIRQFALEKLQDDVDEHAATMQRHSGYYTGFLADRLADLKSGNQLKALEAIGRDFDNLRFAWRQAAESRDLAALSTAAEPLWLFSEFRGRLHEGEEALRRAREALIAASGPADEKEADLQVTLAYLLAAQGYMAARRGDLERGREWLDQGIAGLKRSSLDTRAELAAVERESAFILLLQGEFRRGEQLARDVLERTRVSGDRWSQAECLMLMGGAAFYQGHVEDSQGYLTEARQLCSEIGDRRLMVYISHLSGSNAIVLGDYPSARQHLEKAVAISRTFNDLVSRAYSWRELARLALLQGEHLHAEQLLQESAAFFNEFGSAWEGADALGALGTAKRLQGEFDEAERWLQISLQAAREVHHPLNLAMAQLNLGLLAYDRGDYAQAEEYLGESLLAWEVMDHAPETASTLRHLGQVCLALGEARQAEAVQYLARALRLASRWRLAPVALDAFTWVAILMARLGESERAIELLAQAEHHPSSAFETKDRAARELAELSLDLPARVVSAAKARGRSRDWRAAAEELVPAIEELALDEPKSLRRSSEAQLPSGSQPVDNNLPAQPAGFIGRAAELSEIRGFLVEDPDTRLLTLLGPGGIGKTRLAVQSALNIAERPGTAFPAGVWFVSLAPLTSAEQILPALAGALNFSAYADRRQLRQALFDYLKDRQLLLVLDNFEHLIDPEGAGLVGEILASAPGVKVLATSRARLNLHGEQLYPVDGLEIPPLDGPGGEGEEVSDLAAYTAVQLFRQSARRVLPDFDLDPEALPAVRRICQLVQGMPLGIELAAGWLEALPLEEIAAEIERSLDFLQTELYDVPERQRSLRAVFESSWQLLSEQEQNALRALAVFQGSFSREAVKAVAGANLPALLALVNKSWLGRDEDGRFRMHEMLRQYAAEDLKRDRSAWESVKDQHSDYYAERFSELAGWMRGPRLKEAFAEVEVEFDNLIASWNWLVDRQRYDVLVKGLLPAAFWYCEAKARTSTLLEMVEKARSSLSRQNPQEIPAAVRATLHTAQAAIYRTGYPVRLESYGLFLPTYEEAIRKAWSLAEDESVRQEMGAWASLMAYVYGRIVDPYQSAARLRELVNAARERGGSWELAAASSYLGFMVQVLHANHDQDENRLVEAASCLKEALAIFESLGDERERGIVLRALGQQRMLEGKSREAIQAWSDAQVQLKATGDWALAADINWQIGDMYIRLGEFEAAFNAYQSASRVYLERGQKRLAAQSLAKESLENSRYGELSRASELLGRSLSLYREVGDIHGQAWSTWEMGEIERLAGDEEAAQRLYAEAKTLFEKFAGASGKGDYPEGAIFHQRGLGDLALGRGDPAEAEACFRESLENARKVNHEWAAAYALSGLGRAALLAGEAGAALEKFLQALQAAQKTGDRGVTMVALAGMAQTFAGRGEGERAVELASLVASHYASWRETKERVGFTLAAALQGLAEERAAAARERGARLDLWETVEALLR